MTLKVASGLLWIFFIFCNLFLKKKNYNILACIAKTKVGQFKKTMYCSNNHTYLNAHHYICSISEMGKDSWAIGHLWLNHSLFSPKSCTEVFKPVIIDQLFDNFLFGTSHFIPH